MKILLGLAALCLISVQSVFAANVLFVSDDDSSENIGPVLSGDGHTVTTVLNDFSGGNNTVLQGPGLAVYDVIFWSASGSGSGDTHNAATFTNLTTYITAGGRVFVTGYDSVASPSDPNLIAFAGFTSSYDSSSDNLSGPLTGINSLTTGVVNIVGVTPTGGYSDSDSLSGSQAGTSCLSVRPAGSDGAGLCAWSLRTLGSGEIAYVSNGQLGGGDHASWNDTSAGGNGAYNAALRNFAANAPGTTTAPVQSVNVPTMSIWGLGVLGLALTFLARRRQVKR